MEDFPAITYDNSGQLWMAVLERPQGPIKFRIKAITLRDIDELVIFRNNEIVHRVEPKRKEFDLSWIDKEPQAADLLW